jgi:hypothetical protein
LCVAESVNGSLGPPNDCDSIAVNDGAKWWIEVVDATIELSHILAHLFTLEVEGVSRSAILSSLDRELGQPPLEMPNRKIKADRVLAVAPRRFSSVLSGKWFEWAQVLIELDREFSIDVSLDLLVNKQNTADPSDWHLPTPQQESEYQDAVMEAVKKAVASVCIGPNWTDSTALRCTQLRPKIGPPVTIPEGSSHGWYRGHLDPRVRRRH